MRSSRLPGWLKVTPVPARAMGRIGRHTSGRDLITVCEEARCPNRGTCFRSGAATFLILGDTCTRNCAFCAVKHGTPQPPDPGEPDRVADSVVRMGLRHAVITSVTRDDLSDGGASHFAATVRAIGRKSGHISVEVLVPDFRGDRNALDMVLDSRPDVLNHNLETVPRLYPAVRAGASYDRSLELLRAAHDREPDMVVKSGIMLGIGESVDEVMELIKDLVGVGCTCLTMGQYLQPSPRHHPVERFLPPEEFDELKELALGLGMRFVAAGPLVRSSYCAAEMLESVRSKKSSSHEGRHDQDRA